MNDRWRSMATTIVQMLALPTYIMPCFQEEHRTYKMDNFTKMSSSRESKKLNTQLEHTQKIQF